VYVSAIFRWVDAMLGSLEKFQLKTISVVCISFSALLLTACQTTTITRNQQANTEQQLQQEKVQQPKRVIFFFG